MAIIRINMLDIKSVLVTGGAGFIGSHIVDRLLAKGYRVRVLDNLTTQVHPNGLPAYLDARAEFMYGDVTKADDVARAVEGMDAVYHKASAVGVGQSMYEIGRYVYQNSFGMAQLLDVLANRPHSVKRMILASSMSAYGEGMYLCPSCGPVRAVLRLDAQMAKKDWEIRCPLCGAASTPIGTPEDEPFHANSIYALTKQNQEDMMMIFGKIYNIPVTAFRYFNVYGPRQSLSNPYTGVAAIFLSRIKNDNRPVVYEDGLQSRDFVSVYDVADVNVHALEHEGAFGQVFNIGTGHPVAVKEVARTLARLLGSSIEPDVTGTSRSGDVRHCYADISRVKQALGWQPSWDFEKGMRDLIEWGRNEEAKDLFAKAAEELDAKGIVKS